MKHIKHRVVHSSSYSFNDGQVVLSATGKLSALITWPSSYGTCRLVETRYRALNEWFVTVLLAHGYHRVLACRHRLLTDRPVAGDVSRIHARIVGALKAAFVAVALFELARTVSARWDATEVELVGRWAVAYNCFALAEELVSDPEFKRYFLLNWWRMKHLLVQSFQKKQERNRIIGIFLAVMLSHLCVAQRRANLP